MATPAKPFAQLLLPFAEKEYIDVPRAARILGVSDTTVVTEIYRRGLIAMIDYAPRKRKRVLYQSVVEFCDSLRVLYAIKDRRPPLDNPVLRYRDEDLLPFPLRDTIGVVQLPRYLGYGSVSPVRLLLEEGRFEAYQLYRGSPWRISRKSVLEYVQRARERNRIGTAQGVR